ncbi:putative NADH2 dehydrogenase (ubiquinone) 21.3K chain [Coleophoma cylindrospora]|uniref:Putative NADH2 dehydrogenase (Ubiquinone) 21.3K chain n=1 Tax=Coleophoma cylindrospora TaxID=1849047 RepID=A0A3D8R1M1_9HELO|nr:putative NADH2 dehydrogenase (ubiquinone) 21.3K chain [Coleophoma cylindrospora]
MASGDHHYHPKDAVKACLNGAMVTGSAGAMVSAIQNTLTKRNVNAWGVFTRTGGTIAVFTAMGATYEFSRNAAANLRQKDDSLNTGIGGFLAGSVLGLRVGRTPAVVGYGFLCAVVLGAFDFTGGRLTGYLKDPEVDEFERKQELRKNRRRPIQETIDELGEGRGIYAPGYPERRAAIIKEKYGIEVPARS